jgi:hypothetical protein
LKLNAGLPALQQFQSGDTIPGTYLSALPGLYGTNPYLVNAKMRSFQSLNTASGNWDVGTPASGKRCALVNATVVNVSGGAITVEGQFKNAGMYYVWGSGSVSNGKASNLGRTVFTNSSPILESTDTLSFQLSASGLCLFVAVLEFDTTSELKSPKILSTSGGNNTLCTCPSGCTTQLLTNGLQGGYSANPVVATLIVINTIGSSVNCYSNNVLSGGSVVAPDSTSSNAGQTAATSVASHTTNSTSLSLRGQALSAGDFINLNTATSGLAALMRVVEHTQAP